MRAQLEQELANQKATEAEARAVRDDGVIIVTTKSVTVSTVVYYVLCGLCVEVGDGNGREYKIEPRG